MISGLRFHHIGIGCRDIPSEVHALGLVGYEVCSEIFVDPVQGVRCCFMNGPGPLLELLTPLCNSSPLIPWLHQGVKMYHQAYEISSMDRALTDLSANRAKIVSQPVPAVAFGGRMIAFLILPNLLLIELIESC